MEYVYHSLGTIMLKLSRYTCQAFTNVKNFESVAISQIDAGKRLDQYLKRMGVAWPIVHKMLRNKCFFVYDSNQTIIKHPEYRLRQGDTLHYLKNYQIGPQLNRPQDVQLKIPRQRAKHLIQKMLLFQNNNIIILNKQGGYSTQGDQDVGTNLFTILTSYFLKPNIHIVHRLDKASTGVVLFAKNQKTASILQDSINNRKGIHKFYLALAAGTPLQKQGLIDCNIEWSDSRNKAKLSLSSNEASKQCLTYYRSIDQTDNLTTYLIKLISGRKHQIRCHLSKYLETPIINDHHYQGQCLDKSPSSIYLHSYCTVFNHPEVISQVFKGDQVSNDRGSVKLVDGRLVIQGSIPWQRNKPDQQKVKEQISGLFDYNPSVKEKKTISY